MMKSSSNLEGFLFDLDGVIIDSERIRDGITSQLVKSLGYEYDRDKLKPLMSGKPGVECMKVIVEECGLELSAEELESLRRERLLQAYKNTIGFVPGFENFYRQLLDNFPVPSAVATACEEKYYELIDARLHLTELFQGHIYRTEQVGKSKPSPDIFLYAAKQIGAKPEKCIVFEDAPNGIVAGLRAGSKVVALTRTFSEDLLLGKSKEILGKDIAEKELLFIPDYSQKSREKVFYFLS